MSTAGLGRGNGSGSSICHQCGKTFSENYGTPFYGIHTDRERIVQALKMVVEMGSMRGAARAMGVDKDTICDWVRKASEHAETFSEYMVHDLHMTAVELDELWTTVKKSRSTLTTGKRTTPKRWVTRWYGRPRSFHRGSGSLPWSGREATGKPTS